MADPSITNLIDCNIHKDTPQKWMEFVDGGDGSLYGIPAGADKVLQIKIQDKSLREFGPDLGEEIRKYGSGVRAKNGSIYCLPGCRTMHVLKITPKIVGDAEVQILDHQALPEEDDYLWAAGALGNDGCIYYMPFNAHRILKLDPNDNDRLSIVGEDLGDKKYKYRGAVTGSDGMIYGLPNNGSKQIIKFNKEDQSVSNVGAAFVEAQWFNGGVLAADNNIYVANRYGQIFMIDTIENNYKLIGDRIYTGDGMGWGSAVLGVDKSIYFPPHHHDRVLKFNLITKKMFLVGNSLGQEGSSIWYGGAAASDGFIYGAPYYANQVLQIVARPIDKS